MARSRKVGILTFHRCINYGSYWQARALAEGLAARGHAVRLLDHRSRRATAAEWRCALSPLLPARTPRDDFPLYAAKVRRFEAAFAGLPLSPAFDLDRPDAAEPCDAIVVGSDEVWNFSHPWYACRPAFFGDGLRAERLVSYAASFGSYPADWGLHPYWGGKLAGNFDAIAVRDDNSRRLVAQAGARDAELVLDPCLQFDWACRRAGEESDEVVVYGHSFPEAFVRSVRRWAEARRLRLVSLGYRNAWADESRIDLGPEEFAGAMGSARAVVTNFFHGCVFAILNRRPFACAVSDYRANKVTALASALGLEDRLTTDDLPGHALDEAPGHAVADRQAALRRTSDDYLAHALG